MKTYNIVHYAPSVTLRKDRPHQYRKRYNNDCVVNVVPYYLHGYFRKHYSEYEKYFQWKPTLLYISTEDELIKYLEEYDADILTTTLYVWNYNSILHTLKNIKQKYKKDLKIIVGGPSCDADKDDWNIKYPFSDYFVVGQGEKAWASICFELLGIKQIDTTEKNIVHFVKKGENQLVREFEYEFIRGIHYSPYLECEDLVLELKAKYEPELNLIWVHETQRGCPYSCAFCDWNNGRTNKVQKRKEINFLDEIDFFHKHKMYSFLMSDANFGMWDVDIDILERMIYHNVHNNGKFIFIANNVTKIVNDNFIKVMDLMIEHRMNLVLKISCQDIHQNVLDAIKRPDDYYAKKKITLDLLKKHNSDQVLWLELILGLPEQTLASWLFTLNEAYSSGLYPRVYLHMALNNSPIVIDPIYKEQYGVVIEEIFEVYDFRPIGNSVEEIFSQPEKNTVFRHVVSCNSFSKLDYTKMISLTKFYRACLLHSDFSMATNENMKIVSENWFWLKEIIDLLLNTSDYQYIIYCMYENFIKYKIIGFNDSTGRFIFADDAFYSLIFRNLDIIEKKMADLNVLDNKIGKNYLNYWKKFKDKENLLNRS